MERRGKHTEVDKENKQPLKRKYQHIKEKGVEWTDKYKPAKMPKIRDEKIKSYSVEKKKTREESEMRTEEWVKKLQKINKTIEDTKKRTETWVKKVQKTFVKNQELKEKKLQQELKLKENALQKEREDKAKEERKKEREKQRLEKIELENKAKEERKKERAISIAKKEIENKAKEARKKERELRRLEKIEQEKIKQQKRKEQQAERIRVLEAKLEKQKQQFKVNQEIEKRKTDEKDPKEKKELVTKAKIAEVESISSYEKLAALEDENLVPNGEHFECPICFTDVPSGEGAVLHNCLHSFCKECLSGVIQHCETAEVRCPFQNDQYLCESYLQDREVKSLVTPEMYEKHLHRSITLAESQAQNSFHCKTSDCKGWCLYEDDVNTFRCPVCKKKNCLTCAAIHEKWTCKEYQDYIAYNSMNNKEAMNTYNYFQSEVKKGHAMKCPQCRIIIMKKDGCDFITCSMCRTDICWATKGRRWGPLGKGDTSGGCRCKVNGKRCHPKCNNCH